MREAEHLIKAEQRVGKTVEQAAAAVSTKAVKQTDVEEARQRIDERSAAEAEQVRLAVVEAAPYLEFNPRKIKRFINTFRLQALVAQKREMMAEPAEATLLARALIIATRWPDLVDAQIRDSGYMEHVLKAEAANAELYDADYRPMTTDEKRRKAELDRWLENPRLKGLLGAGDLIKLLKGLTAEERSRLPGYLVLARTAVAPAAAPPA